MPDEIRQLGVVSQDGLCLLRQAVGRNQVPPHVILSDEPCDLRKSLLSGPADVDPPLGEPDGEQHQGDNNQRRGDPHHGAAEAACEGANVEDPCCLGAANLLVGKEVLQHFVGRGVAVLWALSQGPGHHAPEPRRHRRLQILDGLGGFVQDVIDDDGFPVSLERKLSREHLVEDDPR